MIPIAVHEAGHVLAARLFGMPVHATMISINRGFVELRCKSWPSAEEYLIHILAGAAACLAWRRGPGRRCRVEPPNTEGDVALVQATWPYLRPVSAADPDLIDNAWLRANAMLYLHSAALQGVALDLLGYRSIIGSAPDVVAGPAPAIRREQISMLVGTWTRAGRPERNIEVNRMERAFLNRLRAMIVQADGTARRDRLLRRAGRPGPGLRRRRRAATGTTGT